MSRVEGLQAVLNRIRLERTRRTRGLERGLAAAGLHLGSLADKEVPVDLGELKASRYVTPPDRSGGQVTVEVGYTAKYAIFVHEIRFRKSFVLVTHGEEYNIRHAEDIAARRTYSYRGVRRRYHKRGPAQAWKFLERPYRENLSELKEIVREYTFE